MLERVLIVDYPDTAELGRYILADEFRVKVASTRLDATVVSNTFHPDLIIAEYFMPGLPLTTFVDHFQLIKPVPLLLTGASIGAAEVARLHNIPFLAKPFESWQLVYRARHLISASIQRA